MPVLCKCSSCHPNPGVVVVSSSSFPAQHATHTVRTSSSYTVHIASSPHSVLLVRSSVESLGWWTWTPLFTERPLFRDLHRTPSLPLAPFSYYTSWCAWWPYRAIFNEHRREQITFERPSVYHFTVENRLAIRKSHSQLSIEYTHRIHPRYMVYNNIPYSIVAATRHHHPK